MRFLTSGAFEAANDCQLSCSPWLLLQVSCHPQTLPDPRRPWVEGRHPPWGDPRLPWGARRRTWGDPRRTWGDLRRTWGDLPRTWVGRRHLDRQVRNTGVLAGAHQLPHKCCSDTESCSQLVALVVGDE